MIAHMVAGPRSTWPVQQPRSVKYEASQQSRLLPDDIQFFRGQILDRHIDPAKVRYFPCSCWLRSTRITAGMAGVEPGAVSIRPSSRWRPTIRSMSPLALLPSSFSISFHRSRTVAPKKTFVKIEMSFNDVIRYSAIHIRLLTACQGLGVP